MMGSDKSTGKYGRRRPFEEKNTTTKAKKGHDGSAGG